MGIDPVALHSEEFLLKLPTPRLLNVYRKVRQLKNACICGCGCCEIEVGREKEYVHYRNEMARIKAILDTRENVT